MTDLADIGRKFQDALMQTEPIPHLVVNNIFDRSVSEHVLNWFETCAKWVTSTSHFYEQFSCQNLYEMPDPAGQVLARPILDLFCQQLSMTFGVALTPDRYYVAAHKLVPGMGIGLHTDVPTGGSETHRLLVTFTRGYQDDQGGHLILFSENDPTSVCQIYRPLLASALSFPLNERSFHAVSDVITGERYSLVYSFWEENSPFNSIATDHLRAVSNLPPSDRLGSYGRQAVEYLMASGAANMSHSHRSLVDHLCGVAGLLEVWGCDESVNLAGLCHSVYGTESYRSQLLDDRRRGELIAVIGDRAERLAFAFGRVDRAALYSSLPEPEPVELKRYDDGPAIKLTARDRCDLVAIIWANAVEQLYFEPTLEKDFEDLRSGLNAISSYLPSRAVEDLRLRLQC